MSSYQIDSDIESRLIARGKRLLYSDEQSEESDEESDQIVEDCHVLVEKECQILVPKVEQEVMEVAFCQLTRISQEFRANFQPNFGESEDSDSSEVDEPNFELRRRLWHREWMRNRKDASTQTTTISCFHCSR